MAVKNIKTIVNGTKDINEIKVNIGGTVQDISQVIVINSNKDSIVVWDKNTSITIYLSYIKTNRYGTETTAPFPNINNSILSAYFNRYNGQTIGEFEQYINGSFDTYFENFLLTGFQTTADDYGKIYTYYELVNLILDTDKTNIFIFALYKQIEITVNLYTQNKLGDYELYQTLTTSSNTQLSSILPESIELESYTRYYTITANDWALDPYSTNSTTSGIVITEDTNVYNVDYTKLDISGIKTYYLNLYYFDPETNDYSTKLIAACEYEGLIQTAIESKGPLIPGPTEYDSYLYTYTSSYALRSPSGALITLSEAATLNAAIINTYATYAEEEFVEGFKTYYIDLYNQYTTTSIMYEFHIYDNVTGDDIIGPIDVLKGTVISTIANLQDLYDQIVKGTYHTEYEDTHYDYTYMITNENFNIEVTSETLSQEINKDIYWVIHYTRTPKSYTITFVDDYNNIGTDYPAYRNTVYTMTLKYGETYSLPESVYNSYPFNEPVYDITEDEFYRLDIRYKAEWYNEKDGGDYFNNTTETKTATGDTTYIRIADRAIAQSVINIVDDTGVFDGSYDNYYYHQSYVDDCMTDYIDNLIQYDIIKSDDTTYMVYRVKAFKFIIENFDGEVSESSEIILEDYIKSSEYYVDMVLQGTDSGWSYDLHDYNDIFQFINIKRLEFILTQYTEEPQTATITYYDFNYNKTIKTYNKGTIINTISDQPTSVGVLDTETFAYWTDVTDSIDLNPNDDFFLLSQPLTQNYTLYALHNRQDISRYTDTYPQGAGIWAKTNVNGWVQLVDSQGNFSTYSDTDMTIYMPAGNGSVPSDLLLFYTNSNNLRVMPSNFSLDSSTGKYKQKISRYIFSEIVTYAANTNPYKATSLVFIVYPYDSSNNLLVTNETATLSIYLSTYVDGVHKDSLTLHFLIVQTNRQTDTSS